MPLDPLLTDETLDKAVKADPDTDTVMLWGCGSFVVASLSIFFLSVFPFFVIQDISATGSLLKALAIGLIPSFLGGLLITLMRGMPAACGTLGGFMVVAIFLHLRIKLAFDAGLAREAAPPEYPTWFTYSVPAGVLCLGVIAAIIGFRKEVSKKQNSE